MIDFLIPIATGRDIYFFFSITMPSFQFFDINNLNIIHIIISKNDYDLFNLRLNECKEIIDNQYINKIQIHYDEDFNIDTEKSYYKQMLFKLLSSNFIKTEYYITFDSDMFFTKEAYIDNFINLKNKKCYYGKTKFISPWILRAMKFIKYYNIYYSTNQTPFVFKTDLVKKMIKDIDCKDLILEKGCSEYSIYQVYLTKNNLFDEHYEERKFYQVNLKHPLQKLQNEQLFKICKYMFDDNEDNVIGIVQSRINVHHRIKNILIKNIPDCYYKKPNIAILTVISGLQYYKRYKQAIEIKRKYCQYHNYKFEFYMFDDEHKDKKGWLKIHKLYELLYFKNYDYIFVSDADVIITNNDIRIEDIIFKYMENNKILITTDYNSLNSGNMIWKNDIENIKFINQLIKIKNDKIRFTINSPFKVRGVYEQPTIIYLYNKYSHYRKLFRIIPQFIINSYIGLTKTMLKPNIINQIDNIQNRTIWKKNDFLVHFAGLNYMKDNKFLMNIDNIIKQFYKEYYLIFERKEGKDFKKIF